VEVGVVLGFGSVAFGVPIRGSFLSLALLCVLASMSFSALDCCWHPSAHHRSSLRFDEFGDDAYVDCLWGILLSAEISRFCAARDQRRCRSPRRSTAYAEHVAGASLGQVAPQMGVLGFWLVVCFSLR